MEYSWNKHDCYKLTYHLVLVTKYRNKVINRDILDRLNNW